MHETKRQPGNIHTVNADFIAGALIVRAVMIAFMGYMFPNWTPDGDKATSGKSGVIQR